MITIIGLGNPGEKYKNTRHNVGFMAVDEFAKKYQFPDFELQKKYEALISKKENIMLAKPQTFMNESGKSAKKILDNNNVESLVVIHDDIDLPIGKIKIIKERGSAGHKGVESIIQNIGSEGLVRFRIGIASSAEALAKAEQKEKMKAMDVVLKDFSTDEQKLIDETLQKTVEALDCFINEGLDKAMNKFN